MVVSHYSVKMVPGRLELEIDKALAAGAGYNPAQNQRETSDLSLGPEGKRANDIRDGLYRYRPNHAAK